jgi:hypothetical protein
VLAVIGFLEPSAAVSAFDDVGGRWVAWALARAGDSVLEHGTVRGAPADRTFIVLTLNARLEYAIVLVCRAHDCTPNSRMRASAVSMYIGLEQMTHESVPRFMHV